MKLTRKAFKKYLEQMNPNDIAGRRQDQESCPIAQFIESQGEDIHDIEVREESIQYGIYDQPHGVMRYTDMKTKPWQKRFIIAIDRSQAILPQTDFTARREAVGWNEASNVVTACEALAALEVK